MTAPAQLYETHSGLVVLVGDLAYKAKKPVDLGFLDFRSCDARGRACRRELELNRRLAPDVYLDVASVTGSDSEICDYLLVMKRMPADARLSTRVRSGVDVDDDLRAIARRLVAFHAGARRGPEISARAGAGGLRRRWHDNLAETETFRGSLLDGADFDDIGRLAFDYIDGREDLFAERVRVGMGVDGHGDLTADDIFCLDDYPRMLDCLDFDDTLRWVDVLDDAAFLAMDLEHLGHPALASRFLELYQDFGGTNVPPTLTHHYVAYRAFVRAKVECLRTGQDAAGAASAARSYAELALAHLRRGEPRLILIGGAPATGKSSLANALADANGAIVLGTDPIRREQSGPAEYRYTRSAKADVYAELLARAAIALGRGETVIADATWGDAADRSAAAAAAARTRSRLVQLECVAPVEVSAARADARLAAGTDASQATAAVARQLAHDRQPWPTATRVDTGGVIADALAAAEKAVAG